MDPGIPFSDLLAYNADENRHWKRWFEERLALLDLGCDAAGAGTVRKLLLHIFATELHFANRVLDLPRIDFAALPSSNLDGLFGISEDALQKFQTFLGKASPEDWTILVPLGFADLRVSKRKMVMQAMWHSIHHRAQLATFLRQQGYKQDWTHDFILSKVVE